MQEEVDFVLEHTGEKMKAAIAHLDKELMHVRAGKASPAMLDGVLVDYYGSMSPLSQVANINTPDARTVAIQPWDKKMIPVIEKAIMNSNLGFNPDNNGEIIRINVPVLTEDRRKILVKQAMHEGEIAKVSIRAARKDGNESLKKLQKDGVAEDLVKDAEEEVQKMTNEFSVQVDNLVKAKEKDIMTI